MKIIDGYIPFKQYKTYYRKVIVNNDNNYLVFLHGGPGSTHNSYELLDNLAIKANINLLMYDQIGCGKSSIINDASIYNKETWIDELINLRKELNLEKISLLGHSWGGMLAIMYLIDRKPDGINKLILSSTLSSAKLWKKETHRLLNYLPDNIKKTLISAEKTNDFSSKAYLDAYNVYKERYICQSINTEECLNRKNPSSHLAYITSWGENEFSPSGNLKDYDYTSKLKYINVPTLILSGTDDESTPLINKTIYDNLKYQKHWALLENARHRTYQDQNKKYIEIVANFLNNKLILN